MSANLLNTLFKGCHLLLVAHYADDVIARHDSQLGVERTNHLQVTIADTIEYHGVDIFQYNMLFYQTKYVFYCFCAQNYAKNR